MYDGKVCAIKRMNVQCLSLPLTEWYFLHARCYVQTLRLRFPNSRPTHVQVLSHLVTQVIHYRLQVETEPVFFLAPVIKATTYDCIAGAQGNNRSWDPFFLLALFYFLLG